jgi:uncharacterized membrane protein
MESTLTPSEADAMLQPFSMATGRRRSGFAQEDMMEIAAAKAHKPTLVRHADGLARVHGSGRVAQFNTFLAVNITKSVGSMWCAYAFAALACISLPSAIRSGDPVIMVSWISQTFLQLVLLSVIMVGQNVLAAASDARAEADHETLMAMHTLETAMDDLLEKNTELTVQVHNLSQQIKSAVVRG